MLFTVGFVAAHPARSIRHVVLGKRKRFVALRVLASSFHADAATEARGRFTEVAFIKPASWLPTTSLRLGAETGKGGAGSWQFKSCGIPWRWGTRCEKGTGSGGSDDSHSQGKRQKRAIA